MLRRLAIEIGMRVGRGIAHFDADYYRKAYPDIAAAGADPLTHFMRHGWREGRNPSWGFHTLYYRDRNPSCGRNENPLLHYATNRRRQALFVFPESDDELIALQKRVVAEHFDAQFYRLKYLEGDLHIDALDHYLRIGWTLGFDPSADFSTRGYLDANTHVRAAGVSPLYHHVATIPLKAAAPHAAPAASRSAVISAIANDFDAAFYLRANPDVAAAKVDPLAHYVDHGWREGRDASAVFWTSYYLSANPDVRASGANPLFHYVTRGRGEGRKPNPIGPSAWPKPTAPSAEQWEIARPATNVTGAEILVVVPVYRGYDETLACIHAVLANEQRTPFDLLVVNDRSPDDALTEALRGLAARGLFDYLENEENLGFVRTVNTALARRGRRDVVILNSDAIVHGDWIDRLLAHARRDAKIATITPFSNNATICSYPSPNRDNMLALETSLAELDDFAKLCNAGASTVVPTGVGFCMYMRGAVIDEIGVFDAETFGRGYGEECDFCLHAAKAGYRNAFAHDVFVYHAGQVSFGPASAQARAGEAAMRAKHPDYPMRVALYVRADPAQEARIRLDLHRLAKSLGPRVAVMVTQALGGGVATHVEHLAQRLRDEGMDVVFLKVGARGDDDLAVSTEYASASIYTPSLEALSIARHERSIEDFVGWLRPEIFHVHSLVGVDWRATTALMSIIERAAPDFYCTLHDYTALCHRHHLMTAQGEHCADRSIEACRACVRADHEHAHIVDPAEREARYGAFYSKAKRVFVPSRDVASRFSGAYPQLRTQLRPHEYVPPAICSPPQPPRETQLRVALIGAISLHKGARLLHALALDAKLRELPIAFRIIGSSVLRKDLEDQGVEETGHYRAESEALARLEEWRPHLVFFASLVPETFCYTLSLTLAAGVPPVVFDIGAPAERLRELGQGHILDLALAEHPSALNDALLALPLDALWEKRRRFEPRPYPRLVEDYYGERA